MLAVDNKKYQVAGYTVDTVLFRVSRGGVAIPLEPKVFDLLVYLVRHRDRVVSREELFKEVWDGREVSDATLSNHVKSARKALGDSGELQQTILTIRGRGYQFIAPVIEVAGGAGEPGKQKEESAPAEEPARKPGRPVWVMPLATAVLLLVAVALFGWRYSGLPAVPVRSGEPHLLVVPFEVSGAELAAWQPGADDLTRRVISDLRQVSGLQVKERATAFMFRENKTHEYIRKLLPDVRYALSAVVGISADNARSLTLELDDLDTDKLIWTRTYTDPRGAGNASFADMQPTIAKAVSESLRVTILEDEKRTLARLGESPTKNDAALELYVEGWKHLLLPDHESLTQAIDRFDQAIALDAQFYDAWLAKGEAWRWLYANYETPRDVLPKVVAAFEKARDLRPDSAEPLAALGLTYAMAWMWKDAWQNLTAARALDPNLAMMELGFAIYYSSLGEVDLMKKSLNRARLNDPLNIELADWGSWALFLNGQTDAAREWIGSMMDKHPSVGFLLQDAAIVAIMARDYPRGIELALKARALEDSPMAKIILAQAYGYAGQKKEVRPLLQAAASSGLYTCPYESAVGYLGIGDTDAAMALLEQAVQKRSNCLVFLRVDPRVEPIRKEPYRQKYLDVLAKVGLDDEKWRSYPR